LKKTIKIDRFNGMGVAPINMVGPHYVYHTNRMKNVDSKSMKK
jgi:hypothetical protein